MKHFFLIIGMCCLSVAWATEAPGAGEVKIPLDIYRDLLSQADTKPGDAPASYAFGKAQANIRLSEENQRISAEVSLDFFLEVFAQDWALVPILPATTAITQATINGRPMQLVHGPDGLSWLTREAGVYPVQLRYRSDAVSSAAGVVLPLALPAVAGTALHLEVPGRDLEVSVVPAVNLHREAAGDHTRVQADIPVTRAVQIAWQLPRREGFALSRADYQGSLSGDALRWRALFEVEVFGGGEFNLPLLPAGVTLTGVSVDGTPAVLLVDDINATGGTGKQARRDSRRYFATLLRGKGRHKVAVDFEVAVQTGHGPPKAVLNVPEVPVSHFELTLPGNQEITIEPAATVQLTHQENTVATAYVPMIPQVTFTWSEAVPEEALQAELRANATLYHAVYAEEGVLHGRAFAHYQITRGETNVLHLQVPAGVEINRIKAGGITDWRIHTPSPLVGEGRDGREPAEGPQNLSVFLDRKVKGAFQFEIAYERLLNTRDSEFAVPLLRAAQVHRQRGMLALLAGPELALQPVTAEQVSRVGENQLPAEVRKNLKMTVAHTYKYTGAEPQVVAKAVAPERQRGKFDVQVDTLISVGDVTLKGAATLELNVKTGTLMDLNLHLPADVNVLGLTSPALRTWQVQPDDTGQTVKVEFTQEIEGQFRLELNYERILAEEAGEIQVPTVTVADAEVEYGRIAIEALAALEIQAGTLEQLSSLDLNELPQQLVLKTTNPILLAYRYVRADMPYRLGLQITRHRELAVQDATIEAARYRTLATRDGLRVTTAHYTIRNSRKQFLRLQLPAGAEIWSVFVGGKSEKPAQAEGSGEGNHILIKMMNSTTGFPLEIVYITRDAPLAEWGNFHALLPRPDMVVTHSRWDVYLPVDLRYRRPHGNMEIVGTGRYATPPPVQSEARQNQQLQQQSLRLNVPTQGIHFAFEKLYANQSEEAAWIEIPYYSGGLQQIGNWLAALAVLIAAAAFTNRRKLPGRVGEGLALLMLAVLGGLFYQQVGVLHGAVTAAVLLVVWVVGYWRRRKAM